MARSTFLVLLLALICGLTVPAGIADQNAPSSHHDDEYYELYKTFVDTIDQVERNYVKDISRRELMEAAIQGVLEKLDPYSSYISPDEMTRFRQSVESQFGGIGIQITIQDGHLTILSPLVGTPAYRAGLHAGDRIVEIAGETTIGISIDQAVERLKGEAGSDVTITVLHTDTGKREEVTLTREVIAIETVMGNGRKADDSWDFMLDPELGIGYIRVTAFSRGTADDLRRAVRELESQGLRGLILDLRFNPGGLLTSAIEISDMFVSSGTIVSTEGRNTEARSWEAKGAGTFADFPMVVLVNRYSASASEIVSACLQDHDRAIVVGERTWGKGSVQNVVELEGGASALKLTTASYQRPSGKNIHRFPDASESDEWGVSPNEGYEIKLTEGQLRDLVVSRRDKDIVPYEPAPSEEEEAPEAVSESDAAGESDTADDAESDDAEPADSEEFVDLQLSKAMEFLTQKLSGDRAQSETQPAADATAAKSK